ncbi:type VI secretion system-associated protein TagO [Marinobacter sp. NP-4(2019)]|uniref:type VI secretion system-associated protein VasI n=1 Tax=Marinobacter sp. NP-4(2019) TaxID=2488665 RepID=UPI000FC3F1D5|nr:type VI secretion system-associated protein VasI [Marinobacter sp. NP-4(2019)]AZT85456.1 type VI secretion system-associated protein TagO [Marinobacter sp. NP-4(2019)]
MRFLRYPRLHWWLVITVFSGLCAPVAASQLDDARQCTQESQRLERLACFDAVFGTPFERTSATSAPDASRPARWRQAYAQEQTRVPGDGPLYRDTGDSAGQLVTLGALGSQPPRPILVLQCHNNITELALMVPTALETERVSLGFGAQRDLWRVRDNGFVVSGGRGLPAIRVAKGLLGRGDARISSSHGAVDGLMFDLEGFRDAIAPLRAECGW